MPETITSVEVLRNPLQSTRTLPLSGVASRTDTGQRRILVWGTGQCAREFAAHLRSDVAVVAYVDGRADNRGTRMNGAQVVVPEDIANLSFDRLVVASAFVSDIVRRLQQLGGYDPDRTVAFTGPQDWWQCHDLLVHRWFSILQVGITSRCNLLCQHCPRETDDSVYRDLGLSQFQTYLSRFDPRQFNELLVSDFGENTILKNLLSYLRCAKAMGWHNVQFVTNATNGRRALWEGIFSEDLARRIIVSLEAATPEAFEQVRGFPWKRFAANVATIADCIAKNGSRAQLVFNAVCMKSNLYELPAIVDFAATHAAHFTMVHLNPSNLFNNPMGRSENHLDQVPREAIVPVFREVVQRASRLGVPVRLPEPFPEIDGHGESSASGPGPRGGELLCTQPFRWVEIGDNGNVYPCCQMAKRFPVGNLNSQTFDEIWNGPAYRRLLDGLKPGGTPIDVCRECNMYRGKNF